MPFFLLAVPAVLLALVAIMAVAYFAARRWGASCATVTDTPAE
jgi:hypothetical protein